MLLSEETIHKLIEYGKETEFLEYKAIPYYEDNQAEFIKDIDAMANSRHAGLKCIVIGVNDDGHNNFSPIGIPCEYKNLKDFAHYEDLIQNSITPSVSIEFKKFYIQEKLFVVITIFSDYINGPYSISAPLFLTRYNGKGEKIKDSLQGQMYIRIGTVTRKLNPLEVKEKVNNQGSFDIYLLDSMLFVENDGIGMLPIKMINGFKINKAFTSVNLSILRDSKTIYTRSTHWFETYNTAKPSDDFFVPDYYFEINAFTEKIGTFWFIFGSTDALVCHLDEYGNNTEKLDFKLSFFSTPTGLPMEFVFHDCSIFAMEKVLWKIKLREEKNR
ncbi:MAG TPA: ATP-binding protein [Bacillota bacterium]|nr:ATP-binding protein [Bacillota bacterium]HPF42258.1 ATP-binding protein [Bacillota bacterium]HPJ85719.1 ATP-binding protein [Bacillota bacterium]HPQ61644.1 ATP-binding protein [Bacillota bacterium]